MAIGLQRLDLRSSKAACVTESQTQSKLNSLLLHNITRSIQGVVWVYTTFKARLQLKPGISPKFCKARPLSSALRQVVEQELDFLGVELRHDKRSEP